MEITFIDEQKLLSEEKINEIAELLDFAGDYLKLKPDTEMSVTFMNNAEIREINRDYRNKDQATDVISFALDSIFGYLILEWNVLHKPLTIDFSTIANSFKVIPDSFN